MNGQPGNNPRFNEASFGRVFSLVGDAVRRAAEEHAQPPARHEAPGMQELGKEA